MQLWHLIYDNLLLTPCWHNYAIMTLCSKHHSIWQEMSFRTRDTCACSEYGYVLCCSWFLCLNSVFNLHLRYSCTFVYSQTGRTFLTSLSLYLIPHNPKSLSVSVSMIMFSCGVCVNFVSQTNNPDAKTLILVSIQLLICCLQFLL